MQPQNQPTPEPQPAGNNKPKGKYGKRPMWQWVVLYLVVAVIVYGLIYYLFMRDSSSTGGLGY